ncbi:MAG: hypothetical protein HC881_10910 [Leptolyngbyaceae cyanobacterium SL_7_1]|nr:hypothetical protein [Leptolyngbyaceae cyanobacterium SL_7_1]
MAVEHCSENRQHAIAQPYPLSLYRSIDKIHTAAFAHKDFQLHYRNPGIPVVVGGLLDDTSDWNLDSLCQVLGDYVFPIRHYGQDRYQQDKRQWTSSGSGVEARSMTFAEYANHLQTGAAKQHDLYLARCSLRALL